MFKDFIDDCFVISKTEKCYEALNNLIENDYWDNYYNDCFGYNGNDYEEKVSNIIDTFDDLTYLTSIRNRVVFYDDNYVYKFLVESDLDLNFSEVDLDYQICSLDLNHEFIPKSVGCIKRDEIILVLVYEHKGTPNVEKIGEGLAKSLEENLKELNAYLPNLNDSYVLDYGAGQQEILDFSNWQYYGDYGLFIDRLIKGGNKNE